MVNGLYTASESMSILQQKVDTVTHNLANANTNGFKKAMLISTSEVTVQRNDEYKLHQDEEQNLSEKFISFEQGPILTTEDPFDVAIAGEGFFEVETADGRRLTRNGAFTRNAAGHLVNLAGNRVLDRSGSPIEIMGENINIAEDGGVYVDGKNVGRLSIVNVEDTRNLEREGGNLLRLKEGAPGDAIKENRNPKLIQGSLEGSNVNTVDSMVQMIRFHRNYDINQKVVTSVDETLQKAVNEVGRVQ